MCIRIKSIHFERNAHCSCCWEMLKRIYLFEVYVDRASNCLNLFAKLIQDLNWMGYNKCIRLMEMLNDLAANLSQTICKLTGLGLGPKVKEFVINSISATIPTLSDRSIT